VLLYAKTIKELKKNSFWLSSALWVTSISGNKLYVHALTYFSVRYSYISQYICTNLSPMQFGSSWRYRPKRNH